MKLFGFFKSKQETPFQITEADREWVEDNFKWLVQLYGYPNRQSGQIELNETSFPQTFKAPIVEVRNIIDDLCSLLHLNSGKIIFELHEDIRDTSGVPYEIEGMPFESETVLGEDSYKIFIAKSLLQHPQRLIFSLIYECIKIRLSEDKLQYDTGEDTSLFIYLTGVYFGFGLILSQNLVDRGSASNGVWETKWNYVSDMPNEVMAFALAFDSKLVAEDNPSWKNHLPKDLKSLFESAIRYLEKNPSQLFSKAELDSNDLFQQAEQEFLDNDFDAAITTSQKILFLTNDELLKAEVYNNIGYYQVRKGDLEQSIRSFKKALEIDSNFGYAYDNLAYALIRIGSAEEGWQYLEQARATKNNDKAYSYRNHALYYQAVGNYEMAEKNYELALQCAAGPVDLLEFHYGEYLLAKGESDKGSKYINIAIDKGEPEAVNRIKNKN
ncbi:tetratricopeptide repeat protein [Cesiribacter andamanensis]|uniref:Putative O-linked N-acetylglucosamine transferase, SPINDLY family n=1 Tax=Cesiribacter andamanensis AMV16 TaxID=1279009 RepID=M7N674_9BACT|nr:tetratricopeptide repeat protein [Cesiribacter andamanensis]EMR02757.1 putative O-linked N-acetylglucosamine transferase, SPINDLY family [Cesiribacter andamanensis AMV16]